MPRSRCSSFYAPFSSFSALSLHPYACPHASLNPHPTLVAVKSLLSGLSRLLGLSSQPFFESCVIVGIRSLQVPFLLVSPSLAYLYSSLYYTHGIGGSRQLRCSIGLCVSAVRGMICVSFGRTLSAARSFGGLFFNWVRTCRERSVRVMMCILCSSIHLYN